MLIKKTVQIKNYVPHLFVAVSTSALTSVTFLFSTLSWSCSFYKNQLLLKRYRISILEKKLYQREKLEEAREYDEIEGVILLMCSILIVTRA